MKLRWVSEPTFQGTGYSNNVRELIFALNELGVDAKAITSEEPWPGYEHIKTEIDDIDEETHVIGRTYTYDALEPYTNKAKSISGILCLEGDRLPESWVATSNVMDYVYTASHFGEQQFINNGIIPEKIKLLPHGVQTKMFYQDPHYTERWPEFTFCFVGGFAIPGDRKGADIAALAFRREFKDNERVRLVLKINKTYNPSFDVVKYLSIHPKITVLDQFFSPVELSKLYNITDVHVLPSLGEAFSQNLAESMACGTPVITTNYSGPVDFCLPEFSYLIDVEKFVVAHYGAWDVECGTKWAQPSIKHLQELMRYCSDNPGEVERKGHKAMRFIHDNYRWSHSALKLVEILKNA